MDSRLLNVFHDDPFDGSYIKYDDNNADFWSSGSDSLGLQLAETLHGILPIAPTEDVSVFYGNTILKDDYTLECKEDTVTAVQTKNALIYDDFAEHHVAAGGAIEIVTVDPDNLESGNDDSDADDESDVNDAAYDEFDTRSQRSYTTFRSRTDSSSIGDYESHSSDYDDDDDDDDEILENAHGHYIHVPELSNSAVANISNFKLPMETTPNSISKNRTLSTNTIGSDVDGLGLQIDASTFDLADFITKDDFAMANSSVSATNKKCHQTVDTAHLVPVSISPEVAHVQIISSHNSGSDSDSDVIVDVETVEFDEEEESHSWSAKLNSQLGELQEQNAENMSFVDNINSDPSWSPVVKTNLKKESPTKETKQNATVPSPPPSSNNQNHQILQLQQNFPRSFSVVPSKRQCDFLKGKFGSGRGKNASLQQRNLKTGTSKTIETKLEPTKTPKKEQTVEEITTPGTTGKQLAKQTIEIKNVCRMGIGKGGKNLSLIKHDRYSISEQSSEENLTPQKICHAQQETKSLQLEQPPLKSVKRKLNLEEYKKRIGERCGEVSSNSSSACKTPKLEKSAFKNQQQNFVENSSKPTMQKSNATTKNNTSVASIVQSLKAQSTQSPKPTLDPITEAKNKVLRMQELKKAQLLKIIDSTVSAKVPRVTKMLPLKDMVSNSSCKYSAAVEHLNKSASKACNEYEEIVIVSASCNTIISIPPINVLPNCQQDTGALKLEVNNASRSLLKSSALLYNISNTFQKVQASENVKLTSHSLITSIQGVVAKQTSCASRPEHQDATPSSTLVGVVNRNSNKAATLIIAKNVISTEQHGEDKIIMHLYKDRMRNPTCSTSTQTDFLAEFPPLPVPLRNNGMEHKSRERNRQKRAARNYRVRRDFESSGKYHKESGSDVSSCFEAARSYRSRSRSCTADGCSSSSERLRRSDGTGGGGYSSRSSRRHRSSISSSYSESERNHPIRRSRKSHYKSRAPKKYSRSSSNTSTDFSGRSRSRSPLRRSRSRSCSKRSFMDRNVSQPAVEERRIVYVGRIEQETTKEMLRRKFVAYGPIKQITIHYKDTGMKYGFVTYERSPDAFSVIDNSARDSHINMYDISFGGRRAFCRASYADLDNAGINTYQSYVFPQATPEHKEEDSFEALLLKVKAKMNASKMSTNTTSATTKI